MEEWSFCPLLPRILLLFLPFCFLSIPIYFFPLCPFPHFSAFLFPSLIYSPSYSTSLLFLSCLTSLPSSFPSPFFSVLPSLSLPSLYPSQPFPFFSLLPFLCSWPNGIFPLIPLPLLPHPPFILAAFFQSLLDLFPCKGWWVRMGMLLVLWHNSDAYMFWSSP